MLHPGQVGWGSEQPGLAEDVPAHCRGGVDYMTSKDPFQPKAFYDSMNWPYAPIFTVLH